MAARPSRRRRHRARGLVRDDVDADELATYCLHAVTAARGLHYKAAVHRLVTVTLAALAPPA